MAGDMDWWAQHCALGSRESKGLATQCEFCLGIAAGTCAGTSSSLFCIDSRLQVIWKVKQDIGLLTDMFPGVVIAWLEIIACRV